MLGIVQLNGNLLLQLELEHNEIIEKGFWIESSRNERGFGVLSPCLCPTPTLFLS